MAEHWNIHDKKTVDGVAGILANASNIADNIKMRGPCPLSTAELKEVRDLARAVDAMCGRVEETI